MSSPTPSSKTGLWDVPPLPLQGAELCHPPNRHPPPKPPHSSSSPAPPQPLPVPGQTHLQSHRGPPPRSPKEKGRGRSKGLGAHRLQRRETHQAAATAPAPAPEPARGRGGVHWERKEPREWEGSQGAGQGTRGRARRHALQARDRPLHSHGLRARHPQGGGARQRIGPPPS